MMRRCFPFALLALTACSQERAADKPGAASKNAGPAPAMATAQPAPAPTVPPRASRYMPLDSCAVVRDERAEMPYREVKCSGPAGWSLRIGDSDARQTLAVIAPGGGETRLDLSRVSGGAFNAFIGTAEWRGSIGEPFEPDSLILRYSIAEEPHPAPETPFLLAIRLTPQPCLVAKIAPGPRQNDSARAAADASSPCLAI